MLELPRETKEYIPVTLFNKRIPWDGAAEFLIGKTYERPATGWAATTMIGDERVFLFDGPVIFAAHSTGKVKVWVRPTGVSPEAPVIEVGEIKVT